LRNSLLVLCGTLLLDQASKVVVSILMRPGESVPLISGVAHITLVRNSGAAFGLFSGNRIPFVFTTVLAIAALLFLLFQFRQRRADLSSSLVLVLGGALGNLVDRVRLGEVIDFIDLGWQNVRWPVFNVADIAVTAGVLLFCYRSLFTGRSPDEARSD
jgi:signal peptidase II